MSLNVPIFESPLWDGNLPDGVAADVFLSLRDKGYAIIDFPCIDVDEYASRLQAELIEQYDWNAWRAGTLDSLRVQDFWRHSETVKDIAANPEIIMLLSRLYGRKAFPFQTLNFPVGTQQAQHSDHVHFNSVPERFMCGVWLALEDADEDNGPLFYYPGSHRWPSYANEHIGVSGDEIGHGYAKYNKFVQLWEQLAEAQGVEKEYFYAKKGQALIWSSNLVHGGSAVRDPARTRWSQVTHYYFEGCGYYTPVASDVFSGEIYYRNVVDVSTGEDVVGCVSGREITAAMQQKLQPKFLIPKDEEKGGRVRQFFRKLVGRDGAVNSRYPTDGELANKLRKFDPVRYLALHPDVRESGMDPYQHFVRHGALEGREV